MKSASYVHGASENSLLGMTVGNAFDVTVAKWPERPALIVPYENVCWSYAELAAHVDEFAAGLYKLGLQPGDRVGVWAPNCAAWVVAQYATAKIGLILVNINPAYRVSEFGYALAHTQCRALIFYPRLKQSDYLAMLQSLLPELSKKQPGEVIDEQFPTLQWLISIDDAHHAGVVRFSDIATDLAPTDFDDMRSVAARLQFDEPVNIQFTSGTTGCPKAATLTHHNIVNNAHFVAKRMGLSEVDKLCIPVPMYHCFGMVLGSLCCVTQGAAMVFASAGFDAESCLKTIDAENCTAVHGVPTMFIAMLEHPRFRQFHLGSLRTGIMAGAPCPAVLMEKVMHQMHLEQITIAYGMTETGPVSFQTTTEDSVDRRVTTVGRVLPHVEVKIVDQNHRVVARGERGELLTRGYCVMPGYWQDPERTAVAVDGSHWIASGDIAVIDEEGYCQIVGRIKDMLIRGGENIYPTEIEAFLYQHPKIEAVEVIGVPDDKYGEEICAWIKLVPGESSSVEEIKEFCRGKIAHFKVPRYIRFVNEFPMTVTGKVQKFVMREQMCRDMGAQHSGT